MELTATEAQQLAFDFLMEDLNISLEDRAWFTISLLASLGRVGM